MKEKPNLDSVTAGDLRDAYKAVMKGKILATPEADPATTYEVPSDVDLSENIDVSDTAGDSFPEGTKETVSGFQEELDALKAEIKELSKIRDKGEAVKRFGSEEGFTVNEAYAYIENKIKKNEDRIHELEVLKRAEENKEELDALKAEIKELSKIRDKGEAVKRFGSEEGFTVNEAYAYIENKIKKNEDRIHELEQAGNQKTETIKQSGAETEDKQEDKQEDTPEDKEKKKSNKFKAVFVNTEGATEAAVRDLADKRMTRNKEELKGAKGFFSKIWKHNLFREYYRQQEISKARTEILESKNWFAGDTSDTRHSGDAMAAIVARFGSEYEEQLIHEGEEFKKFGAAEGIEAAEEQRIKAELRKLIEDYARGTLTEEMFGEERARVLSSVYGVTSENVQRSLDYGDNLLEVARQVKLAVENGEALENLDLDLSVVVGKAKAGVRTEEQFNTVDRLTDTITKSPVGRFFNETAVASGVAITYSLATMFSSSVARSKIAAWATFGATALFGAGIAGMREGHKLEEERRQHGRETAQGRAFDLENSPRRKEMSEFLYELRPAGEMMSGLESLMYTTNAAGKRELKDLTPAEIQQALAKIAEIEGRIKLSDTQNIDLIQYSNTTKVESERLQLDILRAQAKVDLRKKLGTAALAGGLSADEFLEFATTVEIDRLSNGYGGIEATNELFRSMKKRKIGIAMLKGFATGLVVGGAAQEAGAFLRDEQMGLVEKGLNWLRGKQADELGVASATPLEYFRGWLAGTLMEDPGTYAAKIPGGTIDIPQGMDFLKNTDGSFNLRAGEDMVAENITFDADGSLSEASEKMLTEKGFHINAIREHITQTVEGAQTPEEYLEKHSGDTRIHREIWLDNDTPKPVFDKNELKLWWGGEENTGIDPKTGDYVFNIQHMSPDGSFHEELSVDAQELMKSGKMKMLFSLSQETQGQVFEVPIDAEGNVRVGPDSELGKILFKTVDGKAEYLGKYAEVAETLGVGEDGAEKVRILATHVGKGIDGVPGMIEVPQDNIHTILDIPSDRRFDPPFIIPVLGRTPMERERPRPIPIPGYYGYESQMSAEEEARWRREDLSETLRENPDASLDYKKEVGAYLEKQDKEYREKIKSLADSVEPMSPECKLSVCIPAAGHQEGKNIYKTLSNYLNQTADKKDFEVVVFVNHPDVDKEGKPVEPDDTKNEIERFKKEHPELSVRMMYAVLPLAQAKIGRARKMLTDAVLERSMARGEKSSDVIIVGNDADNNGVAPEYISNYLGKFDQNKNVDAFLGQLDWDHERFVENPLLHVGVRFFQYGSVQTRKAGRNIESSGANFAYRSSVYAAVNGYNERSRLGEDVELGNRIKSARKGARHHVSVAYAGARVSRIYTSARRAEAKLNEGKSPIEMWNDGFGAFDELRTMEFDAKKVNFENPDSVKEFITQVEYILNRSIRVMEGESGEPLSKTTRRSLGWLGIKYRAEGRGIRITDASKLIEGLKEYQTDALPALEKRLNS